MRATSRSTQTVVVGLLFTAAGAVGLVMPAFADAVPGMTASITVASGSAVPGDEVQVTATFVPTTDAGRADISIDLLGTNSDAQLAIIASTPALTGCSASATAIACTWDERVGDGPQTLVATITVAANATVDTSWTVRAVAGLQQTAGASLAESTLAIVAPPPHVPTSIATVVVVTQPPVVAETTSTTAAPPTTHAAIEEAVTTVAVTAAAPLDAARPAAPVLDGVESQSAAAEPVAQPTARTDPGDALPTTGTDIDRSVRLAIAAVVGGFGLLVLARRARSAR